jgi:hypothetical protein
MSKVGNISSHAPATAVFHPIESCMHPKLNLGVIEFDARLAMITVTLIRGFVFLVGVISLATSNYGSAVDTKVSGGASWIAFDSIAYRNIVLYGYPPGPAIPYQIGYFPNTVRHPSPLRPAPRRLIRSCSDGLNVRVVL